MRSVASRKDLRLAWALLAVTALAFVAFAVVFLPRLTNVNFGDVEFTGWSGPMGSRLLRGDRPYLDFVLPIPPGSFVLLAALERLWGRPLLLHELWLNAVIQLGMGFLAYLMARAVTSPKNAVLTAVATLATVIQLNKECAYDHTAQLVAWSSVTAALWAFFAPDERARLKYWGLTGALAGFTLAFKQSTALGCMGGFLIAFLYLAGIEWWSGRPDAARAWRAPCLHYTRGVLMGLVCVWLMLLLLGSTAHAFFQAVFLDASILKGGTRFLVENLAVYLFDYPAYPASLGFIAAFILVGVRVVRKRGSLRIGDELGREGHFAAWEVVTIATLVLLTFVGGLLVLTKGPPGYPPSWVPVVDGLKGFPAVGLVATSVVFAAHLVKTGPTGSLISEDQERVGHAFNATFLAAFACSLMHNTSAPEFRPYYDNNAIIPLTFLSLFVLLDRADLRWLSALLLCIFLGSIGGNKFYRAMTATHPIGNGGHWAGMRVNEHGLEIARAASRVRALTTKSDTVLVLPEDVEIAALIGRPRPKLLGAIVFVDQYAPRLARDDIARLDEAPPKVIVIHPRQLGGWQRFFRIWSGKSGAEVVLTHVLFELLPKRYERDSTFSTTYLWEPGALDVYVLRDEASKDRARARARADEP